MTFGKSFHKRTNNLPFQPLILLSWRRGLFDTTNASSNTHSFLTFKTDCVQLIQMNRKYGIFRRKSDTENKTHRFLSKVKLE